ncbi:MAG: hypothetical protein LDL12_02395 [Anaerolinea sp.]|nr:hypothetical protein [Anaerolinea sp.]
MKRIVRNGLVLVLVLVIGLLALASALSPSMEVSAFDDDTTKTQVVVGTQVVEKTQVVEVVKTEVVEGGSGGN